MSYPAARIERLELSGYRNLKAVRLGLHDGFHVITGENGAGKSSLLEAIAYLSTLKSFRGARTEDLVALGAESARLRARVTGDVIPRDLSVELHRTAPRRLLLDGKRPRTHALWRGALPTVLFHPGELTLSQGGAEGRRAFLNTALEQMDAAYGAALGTYEKALRSRNRLLKAEKADVRAIGAYEPVLAQTGAVLMQARARFIEELAPTVEDAFREITDAVMPLALRYAPRVPGGEAEILRALDASREKDRARGFTAEGPHADDLEVLVRGGTKARHHVSQGQHRVIVLALKVAELDLLTRYVGRVPVLLLDDVSSELDQTRNERFFAVLARRGGQVFLTTTHAEYIRIAERRTDLSVVSGDITARGFVAAAESAETTAAPVASGEGRA